jgi:hypothetical protein
MVDIDKLEAGPELNALVAEEAMGYVWKKGTIVGNHQGAGQESEGWGLDQFNWVNPLVQPYSTDWGAAGKVMEKMSSLGFIAKLWSPGQDVCFPHFTISAQNWECSFWKYVNKHTGEPYEFGRDSWDNSKEILGRGISPSPPLAICRAALKAVELLEELLEKEKRNNGKESRKRRQR